MEGLKEGARVAPGSLPLTDPIGSVREQFAAFPEIPAWPQLPRFSSGDRTGFQELKGMPLLTWPKPEEPVLNTDHPGFEDVAELLRTENRTGPFDRGAFEHDDAPGFFAFVREAAALSGPDILAVKGQCAGPVTLGLCVKDGYGKPLLSSREGMEALREYLLLHMRWQVSRLVTIRKPVVFFLDEPALGSTFEPSRYGLSWPELRDWYGPLLQPLQESGVVAGIHCCGPGPWPWIDSTPMEMFHFDDRYLSTHEGDAPGLGRFLGQGGLLVWGMIPTDPMSDRGSASEVLRAWEGGVDRLVSAGIDRDLLTGRSVFSTACGLGGLSVDAAAEAVRQLHAFTRLWREKWVRK